MGNTLNKTLFTLTYNEQADKAYNEQLKASEKSVEAIKQLIEQYRKERDLMIKKDTGSDYYLFKSDVYITEWSKWIQKNSNLSEGDYAAKKTEMKSNWDDLGNVNQMAIEMERIPNFIEYYIRDKQEKLSLDQRKAFEKLIASVKKYLETMNKQAPADIISKRDDFNTEFGKILKTIDDSIKSPNDPKSLLQGISNDFYNTFVEKVKVKEKAQEKEFSMKRGFNTAKENTLYFLSLSFQIFFAFILAVIVANDFIGRPPVYRVFFFIFTFIVLSLIPLIPTVLLGCYYLFRVFTGTSPVIFSVLPLIPTVLKEGEKGSFFSFTFNVFKKGNVAMDKELEYYTEAAKAVAKPMSPEILDDIIEYSKEIKNA